MITTIPANGTTVALDGNQTSIHSADVGVVRSTHVSERTAQIHAVIEALRAMGWSVRLPSTREEWRLPIMRRDLGDRAGVPLDAKHWRERAAGFVATFEGNTIRVDASGELPVEVTLRGAAAVAHWRHVSQLWEA